MRGYREAVVLIPGFLGFEQLGGFYYFADRVGAALRGALAALRDGEETPVIPVTTLPAEPLAARQARSPSPALTTGPASPGAPWPASSAGRWRDCGASPASFAL